MCMISSTATGRRVRQHLVTSHLARGDRSTSLDRLRPNVQLASSEFRASISISHTSYVVACAARVCSDASIEKT